MTTWYDRYPSEVYTQRLRDDLSIACLECEVTKPDMVWDRRYMGYFVVNSKESIRGFILRMYEEKDNSRADDVLESGLEF